MIEVGESLKNARETSGISLDEVSKDLDIPEVLLEQIEDGNTGAFKDIFELKDYIMKYAKILHIDIPIIVGIFFFFSIFTFFLSTCFNIYFILIFYGLFYHFKNFYVLITLYNDYIIGLICSPSNANSIVFIIILKSATIDLGFVIGLSCLNGTK